MERIIKRWYDMIAIDSVDGNEINLAKYIDKELQSMGLSVKYSYFKGDTERRRPSLTTEIDSEKPGKTFLLIGHIDTVAIGNGWKTDPFSPVEDGDRVYGRGAMDMKGGLAAILETLEYYSKNKDKFNGKIKAAFVSDEEILSRGTYQLVSEGLIKADYALMAECRYDNVAIGFRGRYSYDVTVKGTSAHTKNYPSHGESAIINASKLAMAIEALPTATHPKLKHGTWCIRYIEGGYKDTLIVPDKVDLFVERYVVPGEDEDTALRQIFQAAKEINLEDKVEARLRPRELPYMHSFSLEEDDELVKAVREKFMKVTGEKLKIGYDMSVCDSNILAHELGIPTITFGPSGGNMHSANEYGHPYQVKNCAKIYIELLDEMLN